MILASGARAPGLNSRSSFTSARESVATSEIRRKPAAGLRTLQRLRRGHSLAGDFATDSQRLPTANSRTECKPAAGLCTLQQLRPRPRRPECCCRHRRAATGYCCPPASFARRPLPRSLPIPPPTAEYLRRPTGSLRATVSYLSPPCCKLLAIPWTAADFSACRAAEEQPKSEGGKRPRERSEDGPRPKRTRK